MILPLELPSQTVHLWYMSATDTRILLDNHLSVLDEEERYRANRFHFDHDRIRFILARGSLRHLLAAYTGSDPALIRFKQNPYGKPSLQHPRSPVQFNVTHSGGCIVHAIAHGTEVGVDVELVRDSAGLASVASYFAASEQAWLRAADPPEKDVRFFTLWVCKEAYIKALGRGLSKSLNSFEISLGTKKGRKEGMEGIGPWILSDSENHAASASWRLGLFKPEEYMLGCVAINSATKIVELREYGTEQIMHSLS